MEYIYLALACLCFSVQFIFNKLFESNSDGTYNAGTWCSFVTAFCMLVYLLPSSGFKYEISVSAWICSLSYTASSLLCTGVTILALNRGKVSVVTTYTLLGGMILPFLWGVIAYHEEATPEKIVGILILILSMLSGLLWDILFENKKTDTAAESHEPQRKSGVLFHILCLLLFMTNGIISIASTASQKASDAISSGGFLLLCETEIAIGAMIILLVIGLWKKKTGNRHGFRDAWIGIVKKRPITLPLLLLLFVCCALYAVCNGLGNLFSLQCAKTMAASIQFPVISAVVIILGALFGRVFFHERIEKRDLASLVLASVGIVFFMI